MKAHKNAVGPLFETKEGVKKLKKCFPEGSGREESTASPTGRGQCRQNGGFIPRSPPETVRQRPSFSSN